MQHTANIVNHHSFGTYLAGFTGVNFIVALISNNEPFLQGCASIATVLAAAVSVFFTIRNRKRKGV